MDLPRSVDYTRNVADRRQRRWPSICYCVVVWVAVVAVTGPAFAANVRVVGAELRISLEDSQPHAIAVQRDPDPLSTALGIVDPVGTQEVPEAGRCNAVLPGTQRCVSAPPSASFVEINAVLGLSNDSLIFAPSLSSVEIDVQGGPGRDSILGGGPSWVEGGPGRDQIVGGSGRDKLFGGNGSDSLSGGRGRQDLLYGGPGDDRLKGGKGVDQLFGGWGDDTVKGGGGSDILDEQESVGRDKLIGGKGADRIVNFDSGHDRIEGGEGRDDIRTINRERDIVDCGPGNDFVWPDRWDKLKRCERVALDPF